MPPLSPESPDLADPARCEASGRSPTWWCSSARRRLPPPPGPRYESMAVSRARSRESCLDRLLRPARATPAGILLRAVRRVDARADDAIGGVAAAGGSVAAGIDGAT